MFKLPEKLDSAIEFKEIVVTELNKKLKSKLDKLKINEKKDEKR